MTTEPNDLLRPLRQMPVDITLQASIQRAATLQSRHRRVRRTTASVIGAAMVLGVAAYVMLQPARMDTPSVVRPSVSTHVATPVPAPVSTPVPTPVPSAPPATTTAHGLRVMSKRAVPELRDAIIVSADEAMMRALSVDLTAVREIRAHLGSGDRVVVVDNTTDQETCIQVTCEGGDARSIVCTAPAPSPVRVTTVQGALLYDIDRADGEDRPGPYVAVRTAAGDEDVLLWYEATPDLQRKLGLTLQGSSAARSWLRPDRTTSILRDIGSVGWSSVAIRHVDGSSTNIAARWIDHHDGTMELVLQDVRRGTYAVEVRRADGTRDRFLHVVR